MLALKDAPGKYLWEDKGGSPQFPVTGISANESDWQGFYNQQQAETFVAKAEEWEGWQMNNFPAFYACKNYTPAAPARSSGWFLPSQGQLKAIGEIAYTQSLTNQANIAPNILRAGGEDYDKEGGYYWSSSETENGNRDFAYSYNVYAAQRPGFFHTRDVPNYVRPILAF